MRGLKEYVYKLYFGFSIDEYGILDPESIYRILDRRTERRVEKQVGRKEGAEKNILLSKNSLLDSSLTLLNKTKKHG